MTDDELRTSRPYRPDCEWTDWLFKPQGDRQGEPDGAPLGERLFMHARTLVGQDAENAVSRTVLAIFEGLAAKKDWGFPIPDPSVRYANSEPDYRFVSGYLFRILQHTSGRLLRERKNDPWPLSGIDEENPRSGRPPTITGIWPTPEEGAHRERRLKEFGVWTRVVGQIQARLAAPDDPQSPALFDHDWDRRASHLHLEGLLGDTTPARLPEVPREVEVDDGVDIFTLGDSPIDDENLAGGRTGDQTPDDHRAEPFHTRPSNAEVWTRPEVADAYFEDRFATDPRYLRPNAADDFNLAFHHAFWRALVDVSGSIVLDSSYVAAWEQSVLVDDLAVVTQRIAALRAVVTSHHTRMMKRVPGGLANPGPRLTDRKAALFPGSKPADVLGLARRLLWRAVLVAVSGDPAMGPPTAYFRGTR